LGAAPTGRRPEKSAGIDRLAADQWSQHGATQYSGAFEYAATNHTPALVARFQQTCLS
jgi:hypothetical protein